MGKMTPALLVLHPTSKMTLDTLFSYLSNRTPESCILFFFLTKQFCSLTAPPKKAKKTKEPEAPILYEDPPDKMTSKDGRDANMKITSWNVDGLRAWVKKNGLDVSFS